MRIISLTAVAMVAATILAPTASADPDTCRIAPDGLWYDNTGARCRSDDLDQWRVGNSPQLTCWWYPSRCEDHSGAGPGAK